jgi:hypothetical protein
LREVGKALLLHPLSERRWALKLDKMIRTPGDGRKKTSKNIWSIMIKVFTFASAFQTRKASRKEEEFFE